MLLSAAIACAMMRWAQQKQTHVLDSVSLDAAAETEAAPEDVALAATPAPTETPAAESTSAPAESGTHTDSSSSTAASAQHGLRCRLILEDTAGRCLSCVGPVPCHVKDDSLNSNKPLLVVLSTGDLSTGNISPSNLSLNSISASSLSLPANSLSQSCPNLFPIPNITNLPHFHSPGTLTTRSSPNAPSTPTRSLNSVDGVNQHDPPPFLGGSPQDTRAIAAALAAPAVAAVAAAAAVAAVQAVASARPEGVPAPQETQTAAPVPQDDTPEQSTASLLPFESSQSEYSFTLSDRDNQAQRQQQQCETQHPDQGNEQPDPCSHMHTRSTSPFANSSSSNSNSPHEEGNSESLQWLPPSPSVFSPAVVAQLKSRPLTTPPSLCTCGTGDRCGLNAPAGTRSSPPSPSRARSMSMSQVCSFCSESAVSSQVQGMISGFMTSPNTPSQYTAALHTKHFVKHTYAGLPLVHPFSHIHLSLPRHLHVTRPGQSLSAALTNAQQCIPAPFPPHAPHARSHHEHQRSEAITIFSSSAATHISVSAGQGQRWVNCTYSVLRLAACCCSVCLYSIDTRQQQYQDATAHIINDLSPSAPCPAHNHRRRWPHS